MGGSSKSQTVGYKYYAKIVSAIGCPIEDFIGINFDKRGWQYGTRTPLTIDVGGETKTYGVNITINQKNLFGQEEGGVAGSVHCYYGTNYQPADIEYAAHLKTNDKQAVAYQGSLSYLVFTGGIPVYTAGNDAKIGAIIAAMGASFGNTTSFYWGNSGYIKEMLLWVRRINIRPSLKEQWYSEKAKINTKIISKPIDTTYKYHVQDGFTALSQLWPYAAVGFDDSEWSSGQGPFGYVSGSGLPEPNTTVMPGAGRAIMIRERITIEGAGFAGRLKISMRHDDGGVLYWNGEQIPLTIDSYYESTAIIPANKIQSGENILFCAAVDTVPSGTAAGIYLYLKYDSSELGVKEDDINPIHVVRELFTENVAMNWPESDMNDVLFKKAADQIYSEGLGVSGGFQDKNCKEAIDELLYHIEGGIRQNRQTGLVEPILFRDDWYDLETALHFTPKEMRNFKLESVNTDEAINTLNVEYYDRELIQNVSFPVYNKGAVLNAERQNADDVKFPYFMNSRNATVVANWKLKQLTTPAWAGSFKTSLYDARKINRYDVIKISFPQRNIYELPVRVMKVGLGDGLENSVEIEWIEVIPFSTEIKTNVVVENPIQIDKSPKPCEFIAYEMSYFDAIRMYGQQETESMVVYSPDVGYLMAAAIRPQNNSLKAVLFTSAGDEYDEAANVDYCPSITLDQDIGRTETSFSVKNAKQLENIRVSTIIIVDQERMLFTEYDEETQVMTVKRGIEHTIPEPHPKNAVFYFVHDFSNADQTEYIYGEIVNAKVLTTTPSAMQELGSVAAKSIDIAGLAVRPYPPANVKINGEYWPEEIETDLVLTWVDRNRIQQTGGEIIGWYDGGVTLENGVTYQLILIERDENEVELRTQNISLGTANTYTFATSAMQVDTRTVEIVLKTVRDGYECAELFVHVVELSQFFSAPYNLAVEYVE